MSGCGCSFFYSFLCVGLRMCQIIWSVTGYGQVESISFICLIHILLGVVGMNYLSGFLEIILKVIEISLALAAWESVKKNGKDE